MTDPESGGSVSRGSVSRGSVSRGSVSRGSGDAAVAAAADRAADTRELNISDAATLPVPSDTANLRLGPEIHPDCLPLLPLVGVWRGTGNYGNEPHTGDAEQSVADFGQQIVVSHDGRPFLRFESISWNLGPSGAAEPATEAAVEAEATPDLGAADRAATTGDAWDPVTADPTSAVATPAAREVGWLRPRTDGSIELLLADAEGRVEVFYGQARSLTSWSLATDGVLNTPTATPLIGATRLYGVTPGGQLAYVEERAHTDAELAPHASALLDRIVG